MPEPFGGRFALRAVSARVIAIDCHSEYSRSKPSLLVPQQTPVAEARPDASGAWSLETGALRLEAEADGRLFEIFRSGDHDPICSFLAPSPDGADIRIDHGYPLFGVGGNNAWCFRSQDDIDELTEIDIDRKGHL